MTHTYPERQDMIEALEACCDHASQRSPQENLDHMSEFVTCFYEAFGWEREEDEADVDTVVKACLIFLGKVNSLSTTINLRRKAGLL